MANSRNNCSRKSFPSNRTSGRPIWSISTRRWPKTALASNYSGMSTVMWENPIVQENIGKLKKYGFVVLDTDTGRLACGDIGKGKLLPWETIVDIILQE